MKKIILSALVMLNSLFHGCAAQTPKFYDEAPTSFGYSYSGTMAFPIQWYEVDRDKDGTVRLSYSHDTNDITIYKAPDDLLEKIGAIARDSKLYKLKSHYDPPFEVLDGYGWHINIIYPGDSIWSGGTNAWPREDYLNGGISSILSLLHGLVEAAAPEDIIGTSTHH